MGENAKSEVLKVMIFVKNHNSSKDTLVLRFLSNERVQKKIKNKI